MYGKRKLIASVSALAILSLSACSIPNPSDGENTPSPKPSVVSTNAPENPSETTTQDNGPGKAQDKGNSSSNPDSTNGTDWTQGGSNTDSGSVNQKDSSTSSGTVSDNGAWKTTGSVSKSVERAAEAVHRAVAPKWSDKKSSGSVKPNRAAHKTPGAPQTLSPTAPKPVPGKVEAARPGVDVKPAPAPKPSKPAEDLVPWFNEDEYLKALENWNTLIEDSKNKFENNKTALAEAEKDLAAAKAKYDAVSAIHNTLLQDLNKAQADLDRAISANSSAVEAATKKYNAAKDKYESILSAKQHYSNQIAEAEQRISAVNAQTSKLMKQQSDAVDRVDRAKKSLEKAKSERIFDITKADQATLNRLISNALMERINEYRVLNGLHELVSSEAFNDSAEAWSKEMARTGKFDHSTGSFKDHDGENIAKVSLPNATASEIVDLAFRGWVKSAGHNTQMLAEGHSASGIGVEYNSETSTYYITNKFFGTDVKYKDGWSRGANPLLKKNESKLYTPDGSASEKVGTQKSRFESVAKPVVDPTNKADYSNIVGGKDALDLTDKAKKGTDSRLENLGSPDPVKVGKAQKELKDAEAHKSQVDSNLEKAKSTKEGLTKEKEKSEKKLEEVKALEPEAAKEVAAAKDNLEKQQKVAAPKEAAAVEEAQKKVDAQKPEYNKAKSEYEAESAKTKAASKAVDESKKKLAKDIESKPTKKDHTEMISKKEKERRDAEAEKSKAPEPKPAPAEKEAAPEPASEPDPVEEGGSRGND